MLTQRYSLLSPAVPFDALRRPFIDRFGQFAHSEWPEKVHDERELPDDLARELATMRAAPSNWNEWGGAKDGPALEASGAFRTEKIDGRWWLVDPSGHPFFSHGLDTLRHYTDAANGREHPDWYETEPPKNGRMTFTHWNLQRKFAKIDYISDYYRFIHARLASWGMNTIGRWGAWRLPSCGRTPYILLLDSPAKAPRLPGTRIYDVFHPDFGEKFRAGVLDQARTEKAIAAAVDDPLCIGLSLDNEFSFDAMIGVMMAQDIRNSPAKNAFFAHVQHKYGSLAAINSAWGTNLSTWPSLATLSVPLPGAGFAADAEEFRLDWLERYFGAARAAVKTLAPDRLYFSAAFAGMEQPAAAWDAAARFADVLVADVHERDAAALSPLGSASMPDKPLLVGAFTFGCLDRGMFAAGPCPTPDQTARAAAYGNFMRGALENPRIVGCHYFQYRDQPLVGRDDGEAFQIGFVDVCDRPYGKLSATARKFGETMYGRFSSK